MGRQQPKLSIDLLQTPLMPPWDNRLQVLNILIGEIKRHKRGAVVAAAAMILAIAALAYFFFLKGGHYFARVAKRSIRWRSCPSLM